MERPTHTEIAARAEKLFLDSGCVPGRDEQNWILAEAQIKEERGATGNRGGSTERQKPEAQSNRGSNGRNGTGRSQ